MKSLRNIRFRTRMAVSYIALSLVPFLAFTAICGGVMLNQARQTAEAHTTQLIDQVSSSIDVYISSFEKTALSVALDLQQEGAMDSADQWKALEEVNRRKLENIASSYPEIAGILVASSDDQYISTGMQRISSDSFARENWYINAQSHPDELVLISDITGRNIVTNEDYSVDDVFSLAKAVRGTDGEVKGVILFDIRHDIIKDAINRASVSENGFVFVLDQSDNIVYSPVNKVVYRIDPAWFQSVQTITTRINGGNYQISSLASSYTGWKTVGVFSLDEVMKGFNTILWVFLMCICVLVALVLYVSFAMASTITRPISKLQRLMKEAEEGNLSVRFNSRYNDEIGQLGNSFNHMVARIDALILQVYQEQQSKRDAELRTLQEQIKPHFLYNTLDTISWMARDYNAQDIVKLVDALTSMFRIGLSRGQDFITMKNELTQVTNYLYIQKIRYKDKLNYEIHEDQSIASCMVPKLILQPLVENAIYHGIKLKRGGGTIWVSTSHDEDGDMQLTVRDNGAGITPEHLAELRKQLDSPLPFENKKSFGLFYIEERIRLCYGPGYGLHLDGGPDLGMTITINLPAMDHAPERKELTL